MDVVKSNLNEAYKQLNELLPTASFISFDEEMTGIRWSRATDYSLLDTPEIRYQKMKVVASNYRIIQIGFCLFHQHPTDPKTLIVRPYNFYTFPKGEDNGYNPRITMEAAAIAFNKSNHMDFQKWIYEGCTYLQAKQAQQLARKLNADVRRDERRRSSAASSSTDDTSSAPPRSPSRSPITLTRDDDIAFVNGTMDGVEQWMKASIDTIPTLQLSNPAIIDSTKYQMPECNSFLRLALTQRIETGYPNLVIDVEEGEKRWKTWSILRLTPEQKIIRDQEQLLLKQQQYDDNVGFRRIWELIYQSQKPVVGHNCLYDLMFAWSHFEADLPDTLTEFKRVVHNKFPKLYDTKMIIHSPGYQSNPRFPFKQTSLGEVYQVIKDYAASTPNADIINIQLAPGFNKYDDTSKLFHEAAFDAFITGYVFANIYRDNLRADDHSYLNRYYLMQSLYIFNLNPKSQVELYNYDTTQTHVYVITGTHDMNRIDILNIIAEALSHVKGAIQKGQMDIRNVDDKMMLWIHNPNATPSVVLPTITSAFIHHKLSSLIILSWSQYESSTRHDLVNVLRTVATTAQHVVTDVVHAVESAVVPIVKDQRFPLFHVTGILALGVGLGIGLARLWPSLTSSSHSNR